MAQFEGRLENAPVVYVLCQIRFSPVEKMGDYIPAIQEALRAQYPNFEPEQIGGVTLAPNAQPVFVQNQTRWRFETRDSFTGFMLSTNQLITHTTNYVDSDDFRERIVFGFRTIHEAARLGFIQRIGLRYIDLITASADDRLEDYIHPALVGFRPRVPGLTPDVSQQFLRTRSSIGGLSGTLLLKVSRALHAGELPADLLPTSLHLRRRPPSDQESIFLDWDHYVEQSNLDPDPQILTTTLRNLKAPIAAIFKEAITEHAVKRWRRH
jgi:uncharacterized protein (TIGR04255 family)